MILSLLKSNSNIIILPVTLLAIPSRVNFINRFEHALLRTVFALRPTFEKLFSGAKDRCRAQNR